MRNPVLAIVPNGVSFSRLFNGALLLILLFSGVLPVSPVQAQEPDPADIDHASVDIDPDRLRSAASADVEHASVDIDHASGDIPPDELVTASDPPVPAMDYLYPADLDPPEQCNVLGKAPFGEDVEILLGPAYGYDTYRLNQDASWGRGIPLTVPGTGGRIASSSNNVAAVAMGTDRIVAVWREDYHPGLPVYSIWNARSGWLQIGPLHTGVRGSYESQVKGDPDILSRHPKNWVAFVRDSDDYIQYREWNDGTLGDWQTVPGAYRADSDPAVISTGPSHMAVFFKDSDGTVKFSEWTGGVGWRSEPVSLGKPAGTTFSTDLSVVSRNESHIAVFGMTANNKLWVKEWTSQNESDWSDTEWVYLMGGYSHFKPAVVSRHTNHMGVAVLTFISDSGVVGPRYKEWTYQSGWKASVDLPVSGANFWSPLTLAATSTDEMWLFGVGTDHYLRRNRWREDGGWSGWRRLRSSSWKASSSARDWTVAAVVRRPYDVMVIGRQPSDHLVSTHRTTQNRSISQQYQENDRYGLPRGQAIAMVDEKPIWVTVWRSGRGNWIMQASQTSQNWSVYSRQKNLNHADSGGSNGMKSVAAADLDGDGDDEVVVATMNHPGTQMDISVVELTVSSSSVSIASSKTTREGLPVGTDVNVAVGDLDGDGHDNEVIVGYMRLNSPIVKTFLYQYTDGSLQFKERKKWTLGPLHGVHDMELTIGKVRRVPGEQLIIGVHSTMLFQSVTLGIYRWGEDQRGDRQLEELQTSTGAAFSGANGEYSTALVTGDVDADGLEEIVYTYGPYIRVIDGNSYPYAISAQPAFSVDGHDARRSLAVGDLDWDGKAEVVYTTNSGDGYLRIVEKEDDGSLIGTGDLTARGVPLVADLDNDSHEADLAGCKEFREVSVIAVVNGAPRYYRDNAPIYTAGGGVANSSGTSSSHEDGWNVNLGGFASVGCVWEVNIPVLSTKVAEFRFHVTTDFMDTMMGATKSYSSTTETNGFTFGVGQSGYARGMVVYDEAMYKCYYYDVYKPHAPGNASRAMACTPTSNPVQAHTTLERWHSTEFKDEATGSWADVGRDSNDVLQYPSANPIDAYRVKWAGNELLVHESDVGGLYTTWSIEESTGEDQIEGNSWDLNTTVSAGATIGNLDVEGGVTAGYGEQWTRSVGWEESLCIEGQVEHFKDADCPGCSAYRVVPYVYQATAVSEAGETYPYLEADYYVPSIGSAAGAEVEATSQTIVGLAPQAPVITSTTHPDPNTWYPTSTVTFEWSQPAGDGSAVSGYRWNLDHTEAITPTSLRHTLTDTHTYEGVADGVYYLHLQAVGDGGDYGPVAHRAVRVDANPPQVDFALDPMVSSGLFDWYNTPVTATVSATDTAGSGVTAVEYRVDGGAWQPYGGPIVFATDTPTTTLWARATDGVGHTSDPVSTTVKVDRTAPSLLDGDGYRLTYAGVITDGVGNAQLVLGGALSDTLSGRLMTEIKLGDEGLWRAVDAVGEFPIPAGNELSSTQALVNWIYTPTFEARGAWTIWGRGTDRAGAASESLDLAGFYWEPDAAPELTESRVSVAPGEVYPGDVVTFTLGVRNTGYQESRVALTDTVPAELTVLSDTISGGGQYDAGGGTITWTLDALWPGQTRYLFFSARVDGGLAPTEPLTLENRLDVLGYWVWEDPYGVMPPAPPSYAEVATTTVTVLTSTTTTALGGASSAEATTSSTSPPAIWATEVLEGPVVDDPLVTLFVEASPEADFLYVKEWVWDTVSDTWTLEQESGWVPFEEGDGLAVSENDFSQQARYQWTLSDGDGVKYLGVWVAEGGEGRTTNLNDANLIYTNLMGTGGQALDAGERVQYRVPLRAEALAVFNLVTLSGDADLYAWKPRFAFRPHYLSNGEESGFHLDTVGFLAGEEGMHVVEVEASSDGTVYRLVTAGDVAGAGLLAETEADLTRAEMEVLKARDAAVREDVDRMSIGALMAQAEKERPAHPLTLSTPYGLGDADVLPAAPAVPEEPRTIYLPLMMRSE